MQRQDDISRITGRPVIHKGTSTLNPAKDLPLLKLIRNATFISRLQLELLIAGQTKETNYDCRNRRLTRLVKHDQLQTYPQCWPYQGRVFAITHAGLNTLQISGMGILSVTADTETLADVRQISHFLGLNQIEIAARQVFNVRQWIGDRQLKSLNIAANRPTQKDYDSIAEVTAPYDSSAVIYLGIEYERTIKSKDRYAQIRKKLETERQIQGLIYFVDNDEDAVILSREVYSTSLPVGVVTVSQFRANGTDAPMRVVQNRSVVQVSVKDYLTSIRPA